MKKITQSVRKALQHARSLLGRLLRAPASQPALQPVPVRSRRVSWRK